MSKPLPPIYHRLIDETSPSVVYKRIIEDLDDYFEAVVHDHAERPLIVEAIAARLLERYCLGRPRPSPTSEFRDHQVKVLTDRIQKLLLRRK